VNKFKKFLILKPYKNSTKKDKKIIRERDFRETGCVAEVM